MVRGLYTAYTGLLNQQHRLDTITNNLANSATTGFKKEGVTAKAFDEMFAIKVKDGSEDYIDKRIGKVSLGVKIGENYTDFTQGNLKGTENTFDLAIAGEGFFEISFTNKADVQSYKYTRDGSFTLTKDGYLVTKDGDFVQGQNGNIKLSLTAETTIDKMGNIFQNKEIVDKVKIVDFEDYNYLKKYGENMYDKVEGYTEKKGSYTIEQGYLEASNANVISEMVEMITISRAFEANQKFVQAADQTLEKDVNLGSL
ncbi:MAG: flagellar basal-body rod protein FlgF [Lachnospiraceae bacterium]|nr:flagellar basal-body rod protein FlgF [Lachnospiraceae bacterium]